MTIGIPSPIADISTSDQPPPIVKPGHCPTPSGPEQLWISSFQIGAASDVATMDIEQQSAGTARFAFIVDVSAITSTPANYPSPSHRPSNHQPRHPSNHHVHPLPSRSANHHPAVSQLPPLLPLPPLSPLPSWKPPPPVSSIPSHSPSKHSVFLPDLSDSMIEDYHLLRDKAIIHTRDDLSSVVASIKCNSIGSLPENFDLRIGDYVYLIALTYVDPPRPPPNKSNNIAGVAADGDKRKAHPVTPITPRNPPVIKLPSRNVGPSCSTVDPVSHMLSSHPLMSSSDASPFSSISATLFDPMLFEVNINFPSPTSSLTPPSLTGIHPHPISNPSLFSPCPEPSNKSPSPHPISPLLPRSDPSNSAHMQIIPFRPLTTSPLIPNNIPTGPILSPSPFLTLSVYPIIYPNPPHTDGPGLVGPLSQPLTSSSLSYVHSLPFHSPGSPRSHSAPPTTIRRSGRLVGNDLSTNERANLAAQRRSLEVPSLPKKSAPKQALLGSFELHLGPNDLTEQDISLLLTQAGYRFPSSQEQVITHLRSLDRSRSLHL